MSSSLLENAKKTYNQGFPLLIHTKFSMLLQAKIHIQHVLRAFFYTNRRKGVKMIFK